MDRRYIIPYIIIAIFTKPTNFRTFPTKPIAQYNKTSYLCTVKQQQWRQKLKRDTHFKHYTLHIKL